MGKLCNEELHNLYSLPNIIRVIKNRMTWETCDMHGGSEKCTQNFRREDEVRRLKRTQKYGNVKCPVH